MHHATVTKEMEIQAAHWLPKHHGKCQHLHGHSYRIQVSLAGAVDETTGMVIDFSDLKAIMNETVGQWDHALLTPWTEDDRNNFLAMCEMKQHHAIGLHDVTKMIPIGVDTTAENLAFFATHLIREKLRGMNYLSGWLTVTLWETRDSSASYNVSLG